MLYVDFEGHHYGLYVKYMQKGKFCVVLTEDNKKVCNLVSPIYQANYVTLYKATGYVNVTKYPFAEKLFEQLHYPKTGKKVSDALYHEHYVEYDFTSLYKYDNRQLGRHHMKLGMVQIHDCIYVATDSIYYAYYEKDNIKVVCIDGLIMPTTKEHIEKAIKEYKIPVFKHYRKELF